MLPDLRGRSQSLCVARCSWICGGGRSWCSQLVLAWLVSDVRPRSDMCESQFVTCAWRKCSTAYRYALIVASGGLRCLVTVDMHGEGGARDLQQWCFAWLTRCFVNRGCCVVMLWRCRGLTKVALWWILLEYQWIVRDKDVKVANNESNVQGDEGRWWERLSYLKSSCKSLVARAVQANLLIVCQMFVS